MLQLWSDLWAILWDAFVHAVSLNWAALEEDGIAFVAWWGILWVYILDQVDATIQLIGDTVIIIDEAIAQMAASIYTTVAAWREATRALIDEAENRVKVLILELAQLLPLYAQELWMDLRELVAALIDGIMEIVNPYIEAAKVWVMDTFGWLLDLDLILPEWLVAVRDAVTWLATEAWAALQSFLADPLGFVLGLFGTTLVNMANWWTLTAGPLDDFLTQDLPALRNLMAQGLAFLQTLVNDPLQTILDLLYPVFLDWVENLIAENW